MEFVNVNNKISRIFGGIRVAHFVSFLCCVFGFVCPRSVSCVPNVVSGLSILDCPFNVYLYIIKMIY